MSGSKSSTQCYLGSRPAFTQSNTKAISRIHPLRMALPIQVYGKIQPKLTLRYWGGTGGTDY